MKVGLRRKARRRRPAARGAAADVGHLLLDVVITSLDARIEPGVQQVDHDVGDDHQEDDSSSTPSSTVKSRAEHRFERQPAHARPAEHGLDHDRTAEQVADMHARDRRHRDQRVAQRVADWISEAGCRPLARPSA